MFKKEYLTNNVPVVMESLKNMRSVVLGIWIKVGSRNESHDKNGISHCLEHMFFKGTKKRTARDIAFEIDSLGGDLNIDTKVGGGSRIQVDLDLELVNGFSESLDILDLL